MPVTVKICGINTADAMHAAVAGGAGYVGLMFYPASPRFLALEAAARLAIPVPDGIDDRQAAAMMLQGLTAHYLLRQTYRVQPF